MPRLSGLVDAVVPLLAVTSLPLAVLTALFVGVFQGVVVFVVLATLVPVVAILQDALGDTHPSGHHAGDEGTDEDPVELLRQRYARGEIDEADLERRLDALLELEALDTDGEVAVERLRERLDDHSEHDGDQETAADLERE